MHVNLAFLGAGVWMVGTGLGGTPSAPAIVKIIGGVILIVAAFIGA